MGQVARNDAFLASGSLSSEQAATVRENLAWAALDAIPSPLAVLDGQSQVLHVNRAWRVFASQHGETRNAHWTGLPYVAACHQAGLVGAEVERLRGALASLTPAVPATALEYELTSGSERRWFELQLQRLPEPLAGATALHLETTARKRAELEATHRLHELAHVLRAATMGALAGSAAHELNQPLTAILSNAQAALRFLNMQPPRTDLVQDILVDIASADQNAGEIIRRIRRLLRKGEPEETSVDLNEVVREALHVVADEGLLRKMHINTRLESGLPAIKGDPVQLQQVVLNLVLNSFDAMDHVPAHERQLTVSTVRAEGDTVQLIVQDHGPGMDRQELARIFEPFFTTKRTGLGMGLFITRAIAESHGGWIDARLAEPQGLRLCVTLPGGSKDRYDQGPMP